MENHFQDIKCQAINSSHFILTDMFPFDGMITKTIRHYISTGVQILLSTSNGEKEHCSNKKGNLLCHCKHYDKAVVTESNDSRRIHFERWTAFVILLYRNMSYYLPQTEQATG
jgi:hypothetical protein